MTHFRERRTAWLHPHAPDKPGGDAWRGAEALPHPLAQCSLVGWDAALRPWFVQRPCAQTTHLHALRIAPGDQLTQGMFLLVPRCPLGGSRADLKRSSPQCQVWTVVPPQLCFQDLPKVATLVGVWTVRPIGQAPGRRSSELAAKTMWHSMGSVCWVLF